MLIRIYRTGHIRVNRITTNPHPPRSTLRNTFYPTFLLPAHISIAKMTEVLSPIPVPQLKLKPILKDQLRPSRPTAQANFNPEKHLSFCDEPKTLSLADVALPEDAGISQVACSHPFPLFSEEAIGIMRDEIFTTEVWKNCLYSTEFAACQLRGHCPK